MTVSVPKKIPQMIAIVIPFENLILILIPTSSIFEIYLLREVEGQFVGKSLLLLFYSSMIWRYLYVPVCVLLPPHETVHHYHPQ